jgi:hypothetical protein
MMRDQPQVGLRKLTEFNKICSKMFQKFSLSQKFSQYRENRKIPLRFSRELAENKFLEIFSQKIPFVSTAIAIFPFCNKKFFGKIYIFSLAL